MDNDRVLLQPPECQLVDFGQKEIPIIASETVERRGQNGTASLIRAEEYADAVHVGSKRNTKNGPTRQNSK